jgi:hypothetical protein
LDSLGARCSSTGFRKDSFAKSAFGREIDRSLLRFKDRSLLRLKTLPELISAV